MFSKIYLAIGVLMIVLYVSMSLSGRESSKADGDPVPTASRSYSGRSSVGYFGSSSGGWGK